MNFNWDGCSFTEEGPWANNESEDKNSLMYALAFIAVIGMIVKLIFNLICSLL